MSLLELNYSEIWENKRKKRRAISKVIENAHYIIKKQNDIDAFFNNYIENDYDEATLNKEKDHYVKSFIRFEADLQKCKEKIRDDNKILEKEKDAVIKEYELKIKAIEELAK